MPPLVPFLLTVSFAAGLNVYATLATLGLLGRFGVVDLPGSLATLTHTGVLVTAVALFAVEFFADKIPVFDLVWNALHTFIRIPIAAVLAFKASDGLSPEWRAAALAAGALLATLAHISKTAARGAVNASPEPVSNIAISAGEDAVAVSLTWLATHHPYAAGGIVTVLSAAMLLSLRWLIRKLIALWNGARARFFTAWDEPKPQT